MKKLAAFIISVLSVTAAGAQQPVDYVNPFIGTTNFGTTNPGAIVPRGMMSVVPFNVMGSELNKFDKDSRWWSTPYEFNNVYFTGYSHVNLSGVGCPDLGSLLLMPTTGELNVDYREYGSQYDYEEAFPGYYTNRLTKYDVRTEVSATKRSSIARFTFPGGTSNILFNLGKGLSNESGAYIKRISDTEIAGMRLMGTFCYNPEAVFPIYFYLEVNKRPESAGVWKKQPVQTGVRGEWDRDNGKYKIYDKYNGDIAGDDIGAWFRYDTTPDEQIEVRIGVSFVSVENARLNLRAEQYGFDFDAVRSDARELWNTELDKIHVEGGTQDEKTVFYTALYHTMIHPNIFQDVNGEYRAMETGEIRHTDDDRYTVFGLWDTYRNLHQLLGIVYPDQQNDMVKSVVGMYGESGWFPRWELFGRESFTMSGDPVIGMLVDSWQKGFNDYDPEMVYEGMYRSAMTPGIDYDTYDDSAPGPRPDSYYSIIKGPSNKMRPNNSDYMKYGYLPLRGQHDNSVSQSLEYFIADYALGRFAELLGKKEDASYFYRRSQGYRNFYDRETGALRPILPDGSFLTPFNPRAGEDFEENPGFHEGSSWNYTFYIPHDVPGMIKMMGGRKKFTDKLQMVFDEGYYDPANEPDIAYPYLFSYIPGEEWRTSYQVRRLLAGHFTNSPDGIPGNDDTGTMSAWAVLSMIGFYPDNPVEPYYTFTSPTFDRIEIKLDMDFYRNDKLVITASRTKPEDIYIKSITVGGKKFNGYRISHEQLVNAGTIHFELTDRK